MPTHLQSERAALQRRDFTPAPSGLLQRQCACGNHGNGGACSECSKKRRPLQRAVLDPSENSHQSEGGVPPVVREVLRSSGAPLDARTRASMSQRFGHDFSGVRVHTDARAADSARAVNALAYTVGRDIAFARDHYRPDATSGRRLLAHELTHVVQQRAVSAGSCAHDLTIGSSDTKAEAEAREVGDAFGSGRSAAASVGTLHGGRAAIVARADPDATGYTMRGGRVARTGLQFSPTNVTDTQVGPITVQGGLLQVGAARLNVIIGENFSLRRLARQLLPLWNTATNFTPTGGAALPLTVITEDELAQALLVYNQTYLPVPAMTNWRSGLRFPLPVEIDELSGIATLHGLLIQQLATGFNPAWLPLLDQRAAGTVAVPAATLRADVTAFLMRETTPLARGVHLGARALTNAVAERPFVREVFRQLGAASFDVALEFMDNLVNREVGVLAAQRDGAAILAEIRAALGAAPPTPTATQQASLTRANLMLGLVAGVAAQAPPVAARTRAEKNITVDTLKLDGSTHNPSTQVATASAILAIRIFVLRVTAPAHLPKSAHSSETRVPRLDLAPAFAPSMPRQSPASTPAGTHAGPGWPQPHCFATQS